MTDLEILDLPPGATLNDVKNRYRDLALELHPDRGGDPAKFNELVQAYGRLSEKLSKPRNQQPCVSCRGKRRVTIAKGFHVLSVQCPDCSRGDPHVK